MYSLNVPVPGTVRRLAGDLEPALVPFDRVRDDPTLVVKRLRADDRHELAVVSDRVREALRGAPPVEARVAEVDAFTRPPEGPSPVLYLAVESPGLRDLHRRACRAADPVSGLEGDDYTPHVTLARGADHEAAASLVGRDVGPVTWTVKELEFYDARRGERVGRVPLPA